MYMTIFPGLSYSEIFCLRLSLAQISLLYVLTLGFITLALELIAQVFNTGYCPSALSATRYRNLFGSKNI